MGLKPQTLGPVNLSTSTVTTTTAHCNSGALLTPFSHLANLVVSFDLYALTSFPNTGSRNGTTACCRQATSFSSIQSHWYSRAISSPGFSVSLVGFSNSLVSLFAGPLPLYTTGGGTRSSNKVWRNVTCSSKNGGVTFDSSFSLPSSPASFSAILSHCFCKHKWFKQMCCSSLSAHATERVRQFLNSDPLH